MTPLVRRLALLALLVAASVAGASGWLYRMMTRPGPQHEVEIVVEEGAPAAQVLDSVHGEGLLPSTLAGRIYVRLFAHGRTLHFGVYRFPVGSRPVDVLERLLDGRVQMATVTVVEGTSAGNVGAPFMAAGLGTAEDWRRVVERTDWIADLAPTASSLEGFLFPETYRFALGTSPKTAGRHMVLAFKRVWEAELQTAGSAWGTPLEVVTLASMVEAETSHAEERARIAGVFFNRLRHGMLLQCDPTVVYALERRNEWQGRLLRVHWQVDDPYNTYRYPGLPPGPINSPGRAAIAAALQPDHHTFLYFVANPDGGHTFSRTLREHNRAVVRLQQSRR